MKKYLTLAAVLGAIAFVSVSYLAQATEPATSAVTTSVETAVDAAAPAVDADATVTTTVETAVDADCTAKVAAEFEGKTPTDDEKAAAVAKCEADHAAAHTEVKTEVMTDEKH